MRHFSAVVLLFLFEHVLPAAEPDMASMKASVVRIVVATEVRTAAGENGTMRSHGSGYLVGGGRYVITNNHVCCEEPDEGMTITRVELMVHTSFNEKTPAKTLWSSPMKDLAVLELERPFPGRNGVVFALPDSVHDGMRVWALGFPGTKQIKETRESDFTATITTGIIGKMELQYLEKNGPVVATIRHSAATNPGNSGGPLFNFCGQVVATNFGKALTTIRSRKKVRDPATGQIIEVDVQERVVAAEGINWSIRSTELLPELDKRQIQYQVATSACQEIDKETKNEISNVTGQVSSMSGRMSTLMVAQLGSLALAVAAMGLALNKKVRERVTRRFTTRSREREKPHGPAENIPARLAALRPRPFLRGVSGFYAGASMQFEDEPWILGRDRNAANLVFPADTPGISKRHCTLSFDPETVSVTVEDTWSTHGTFRADGTRLEPGRPYQLRPGERFYLAEKGNMFEIGGEA